MTAKKDFYTYAGPRRQHRRWALKVNDYGKRCRGSAARPPLGVLRRRWLEGLV